MMTKETQKSEMITSIQLRQEIRDILNEKIESRNRGRNGTTLRF